MRPLLAERDLHGLNSIEIATTACQHRAKLAPGDGAPQEQQALLGHRPTIGCREASEIVSEVGGESEVDGFHAPTAAPGMHGGKGSVGEPGWR